jgi:hypothetical protein
LRRERRKNEEFIFSPGKERYDGPTTIRHGTGLQRVSLEAMRDFCDGERGGKAKKGEEGPATLAARTDEWGWLVLKYFPVVEERCVQTAESCQ